MALFKESLRGRILHLQLPIAKLKCEPVINVIKHFEEI